MVRPRDLVRATNPEWQTVSSSNVHSALFAPDTGDFYVRFLRPGPDDIYVYPNRARDEWNDFLTAASKGSWIWNNPRDNNWPYELLTTRDFAQYDRQELHKSVRRFLE